MITPEAFVGRKLQKGYEIKSIIGKGGEGTVVLANDPRRRKDVAIKLFPPTTDRLEIEQEAEMHAGLHHPNILPFYWFDSEEVKEPGLRGKTTIQDYPYIVMQYANSGSLREIMNRPRTPKEAVSIVLEIAAGVNHAHKEGVLHRDLKPNNIVLHEEQANPNKKLLVTDFGIATRAHTGETTFTRQNPAGTYAYSAPEQMDGQAVIASDVYSAGVMLFEALTGRRPFIEKRVEDLLFAHQYNSPPFFREILGDKTTEVHLALEEVARRALEKDPKSRQRNLVELGKEAKDAYEGATGDQLETGSWFDIQSAWTEVQQTRAQQETQSAAIRARAAEVTRREIAVTRRETSVQQQKDIAGETAGQSRSETIPVTKKRKKRLLERLAKLVEPKEIKDINRQIEEEDKRLESTPTEPIFSLNSSKLGNLYHEKSTMLKKLRRDKEAAKARSLGYMYNGFSELRMETVNDYEKHDNDLRRAIHYDTDNTQTKEVIDNLDLRSLLKVLKTLNPSNNHIGFMQACYEFFPLRDPELSMEYCDAVLRNNPKYVNAYQIKAPFLSHFRRKERLEESLDCYDQVIKIAPWFIHAYLSKAELLDKLNRKAEAAKVRELAKRSKNDK